MASWSSYSQVLYDINFETPDQVINQVVRTGPAPQYASSIMFGAPVVVPTFAGLTHQPLLFTSNGQSPLGTGYYYTQIRLSLGGIRPPSLDLSFDFTDIGSNHGFRVIFDTPQVRNFELYDGQIIFQPPVGPSTSIGTYLQGQSCRFAIHLDYLSNQWSFYENDSLLNQGAFNPSGDLQAIRFNYSAGASNVSGTAIDNILVVIPEPPHLMSVGCVAIALGCLSRKGYFQWHHPEHSCRSRCIGGCVD